jgi:3-oxoacyl-[acyl-carrier-protein] synthase III
MLGFGIKYMDYYVPKTHLGINDLIDRMSDNAVPRLFNGKEEYKLFANAVLDLRTVKIEQQMDEYEMLRILVEQMFDKISIDPSSVDMIVLLSERRTSQNLAQLIQFKFEMSNAFVLNLSGNHCANFDVAISTLARINAHEINNVLILNATLIPDIDSRIIGTYGVLGDAAGVMLLSKQDVALSIVDACNINNGRLYEANVQQDNTLLHTKYMIKCLSTLINKGSLKITDLKKVVVQNANPLLNAHIITHAGIDSSKIFDSNFGKHGHLDCLDLLVNLQDVMNSSELKQGDRILSLGMGWAGSYSSILFSKN